MEIGDGCGMTYQSGSFSVAVVHPMEYTDGGFVFFNCSSALTLEKKQKAISCNGSTAAAT